MVPWGLIIGAGISERATILDLNQERRFNGDKHRATSIVKAFLSHLVSSNFWIAQKRFTDVDCYTRWCPFSQDVPRNRLCPHMESAMRKFETSKDKEPMPIPFAILLAELRSIGRDAQCLACTLLFEDILADIAEHVDGKCVEGSGICTVARLEHLKTGSGKRRRIDRDFKLFAARQQVSSGTVHNAGQYLRVATDVSDRSGRHWEHEVACSQWLCQKRLFTCGGVCGMTEDAARNGRPAEDTTVFLFWDGAQNLGGVLPFQVVRGAN